MSAPTHTRSHRPSPDAVDIRLPWWAVVLPAIAFAALLLLMAGPGQAAASAGEPGVGHVVIQIQQTFAR
ncbi:MULTISPECIES: hypothetical protein [Streptomyces]|uniref:hypothetical protein n=1 Tax=Streptomyces TaxID=1883 RepID=UPI0003C5E992|nr:MULTISPECIES: hypothetical protein [Streptomyces]EST20987.1 hypothetical protein M877_32850 [Streptomyces niveus NCIMB 11891]TFI30255.1 hypothetical protein E4P36_05825 [Streptomyces sp. 4R-3d]